MVKISSRWTYFNKRIFPVIWFGVLSLFFVVGTIAMIAQKQFRPDFLIMPLFMAAFGYVMMRMFVFDLVDEVWDDGDALIIRNRGIEDRILLKDIVNLSSTCCTNPPRATLLLREPSAFGMEITFSPPLTFIPFTRHPIVWDLIHRIDEERRKS